MITKAFLAGFNEELQKIAFLDWAIPAAIGGAAGTFGGPMTAIGGAALGGYLGKKLFGKKKQQQPSVNINIQSPRMPSISPDFAKAAGYELAKRAFLDWALPAAIGALGGGALGYAVAPEKHRGKGALELEKIAASLKPVLIGSAGGALTGLGLGYFLAHRKRKKVLPLEERMALTGAIAGGLLGNPRTAHAVDDVIMATQKAIKEENSKS